MSDFAIFSLTLWLIAYPLLIVTLRYIFKKPLVFMIGVIGLTSQTVIFHIAFGVGSLGILTDLLWASPFGSILTIVGFVILNKIVRKSLEKVEKDIHSFAEGNLAVDIDKFGIEQKIHKSCSNIKIIIGRYTFSQSVIK